MHSQPLILAAILISACSRPPPPEPVEASAPPARPARPWIIVTPVNVNGYGVPPDFVRVAAGKQHVEVWADPNDPGLDLKAILEGAKPR